MGRGGEHIPVNIVATAAGCTDARIDSRSKRSAMKETTSSENPQLPRPFVKSWGGQGSHKRAFTAKWPG